MCWPGGVSRRRGCFSCPTFLLGPVRIRRVRFGILVLRGVSPLMERGIRREQLGQAEEGKSDPCLAREGEGRVGRREGPGRGRGIVRTAVGNAAEGGREGEVGRGGIQAGKGGRISDGFPFADQGNRIPKVNITQSSTARSAAGLTAPNLRTRRLLSRTRNWWQRATESLTSPPSPSFNCTQEGRTARRKLVVKGIDTTVRV